MTRKTMPQISIRRARPSDKSTVLNFCRRTWGEWGDYIDKVWDEWVNDKRGFFAIASLDGKPIGTAKLTVLNKREIWFEGLRVAPSFRGGGISHLLTAFLAREALRRNAEAVRYATGARNRASLHIGKSWGLKPTGRYSILSGTSDARRSHIFERVSHPSRIPDVVMDAIESSSFTRAMGGLASEGWTFFKVDCNFLKDAIRNGEFFLGTLPQKRGKGRGSSLAGGLQARDLKGRGNVPFETVFPMGVLVASPQPGKRRLLIKLVADFGQDSFGELLSGARKLAHELDLPRIRLIVPARRAFLSCAKEVGFREEDEGFYHTVLETNLRDKRTSAHVKSLVRRYL